MSIRGTVVLECDNSGCHAEFVMDAETTDVNVKRFGVLVELPATGWHYDEESELFICPDCIQSAHEAVEKDAEIRACGGYEAWKAL